MTYLRLIISVAILMVLAYLYDQPFGLTILALMTIVSVSVSVLIAGQGSWEVRKHRALNFMSTTLGLLLEGLLAVIGTGVSTWGEEVDGNPIGAVIELSLVSLIGAVPLIVIAGLLASVVLGPLSWILEPIDPPIARLVSSVGLPTSAGVLLYLFAFNMRRNEELLRKARRK